MQRSVRQADSQSITRKQTDPSGGGANSTSNGANEALFILMLTEVDWLIGGESTFFMRPIVNQKRRKIEKLIV